MAARELRFACEGCGAAHGDERLPFSCPAASVDDDVDHLLVRAGGGTAALRDDGDVNPFVAFRHHLSASALALAHGLDDVVFVDVIRDLDAAVAELDGVGFHRTPLRRIDELAAASGASSALWVKDETGNVSGSHKARHLMGVMLYLLVAERTGVIDAGARRPLAIASCGNAALAAAVVARAARWPLDVFVPPEAPATTTRRLAELGATIHVSRRSPERPPGDPCYLDFKAALAEGALPFCCQGPDNGMTLEGGKLLGYELVSALTAAGGRVERIFVQVGGGALASSLARALLDARSWGLLDALPRVHAVQTEGAFPLAKAYDALVGELVAQAPEAPGDADARALWLRDELDSATRATALRAAAGRRSRYMRPWPAAPQSIASGILDDETYDWLAIVAGMLESGGYPLVVSEEALRGAHDLARRHDGPPVCPTGSAGLAGSLTLQHARGEAKLVLFTGHQR